MKIASGELVRQAMVLLNESMEELAEAVDYGDMGMELRQLAAELLPGSAAESMIRAESADINEAMPLEGNYRLVKEDDRTVGEMLLPSDFLRLIEVRMPDWEESQTAFVTPARQRQWLRHHPSMQSLTPALTLRHSQHGMVMRIHGTQSVTPPITALYLPRPAILNGMIWIPSSLRDDVAHTLAQNIKKVTGD